jgi:hypothetical protein
MTILSSLIKRYKTPNLDFWLNAMRGRCFRDFDLIKKLRMLKIIYNADDEANLLKSLMENGLRVFPCL